MDDRRRQSYFPNMNFPQGQTLGVGGFNALPPDQNTAYQAAIAGGRPKRSGYSSISTPSGGTMSVPAGQTDKYTNLLFKNNPITNTGFQRPNQQSSFALGNTGAVPQGNTPWEQSYRMGYQGGVVQQPQTSLGYQIGNTVGQGLKQVGSFAYNAINSLFPQQQQTAQQGVQPNAALAAVQNFQQTGSFMPQQTQPRRYFDY